MNRRLILLGASGNIGEQTLSILNEKNSKLSLVAFSVGNNINKIDEILSMHKEVTSVTCIDQNQCYAYQNKYPNIKFYYGDKGIIEMIKNTDADILLNALVGFVGLEPTLTAVEKKMNIALANKETLVVGGELVKKIAKKNKVKIYPVDSEHSAIYKCLKAVKKKEVSEILLTASGGAFRNLSHKELKNVTSEQALKHPTWKMGEKVTIDSATMLNKGFEIIEAYYLFHFPIKKIKIIMHDESNVHSILHLKNGKYLGEVNPPSMINPIRYALKTKHKPEDVKEVNALEEFGPYHFHEFDIKRYPMVKYALKAIKKKGTMPCVINAVDEVAVKMFLENKINFLDIEEIIKRALKIFKNIKHPSLETLKKVDYEAREWAKSACYLENSK